MRKDQQKELASIIDRYSRGDGIHDTPIAAIHCIKMSEPSMKMPGVYNPSLCVIVQGEKDVLLENETYHYAPSQYLVVSVDLPVIGQVTHASKEKPYLCFQVDIDLEDLGALLAQDGHKHAPASDTRRGLFVGKTDEALVDSVLRLARLLDTPQDVAFMLPLIRREICYRLLSGTHGHIIAQIALNGSNMQRIAQSMRMLKANFAQTIRVELLAEAANMSPSSFHHHFKEVTAMSPLQYQKRLRLMEARRLMLTQSLSAAGAAYEVGYESSSQFSREYARMFGAPPGADMERLRAA